MAIQNEEVLRERLDRIVADYEAGNNYYDGRLNEKGVEYSILLPIIEILWGFDALDDIEYESSSLERNDQRFDLLLRGKFLVESKRLRAILENMEKQVEDYITENNNINYGVLTNGYEFIFFLQRNFIKKFLIDKDIRIPIKREALPFLTISIDDPNFIPIMKLFSKNNFEHHFRRMAEYVLSIHNQGKVSKITGNRIINEILKNMIKEQVDIQKGVFLDAIAKGKYEPGDKLTFENANVSITVSITRDGRVKLAKGSAEIYNMNKVMESDFAPMIDLVRQEWGKEDTYFNDPLDIIRQAQGKKKLYGKEKYIFKKKSKQQARERLR